MPGLIKKPSLEERENYQKFKIRNKANDLQSVIDLDEGEEPQTEARFSMAREGALRRGLGMKKIDDFDAHEIKRPKGW
jgi:hypothetical protein